MDLAPDAYEALRRLAASYLSRERAGHTLQPTALVHEAFLRLANSAFSDPTHFRAAAAIAMRRILVDHARTKGAQKRGGDRLRITLIEGVTADEPELDLLALDEALDELGRASPRRARIVELRYFGGLTVPEVADSIGVSTRTVEGDWLFARAWLRKRLAAEGEAS